MSKEYTTILFLFSLNLFGMTVLYLASTSKLNIYIHPSSQWFVILSALVLLLLGVFGAFKQETVSFEKGSSIGIFCLLLVGILILLVKPTPLSVETAKTRISSSSSTVSGKNAERFTTRKTSDFSIVDWLAAFASPEDSFRYENTPANLSGFLLVQDNQPMIGRLVITCCGADAQPALLKFQWAGELPKENTWIQIKGTMHTIDQKPVLEATSLEIIPEPANPYAE